MLWQDIHLQGVVDPESAQCVQHHLRIVFRFNQHALAVLEIDDVERPVCNDDAVTGSETVRHIAAEVQPLLDVDDRVRTELPDLGDGFQHELHIVVGMGIHLVAVVF